MATFNNQSKSSTSYTNQPFAGASRTFGDLTHTFGEDEGTFGNPKYWPKQSKTATTFTNTTKN